MENIPIKESDPLPNPTRKTIVKDLDRWLKHYPKMNYLRKIVKFAFDYIKEYETEYSDLECDRDNLSDRLNELENDYDSVCEERNDSDWEVGERNKTITELEEKVRELEKEIEDFKDSQ